MKTRITQMFGMEFPIVEAPMAWITDADLAAAVSEAGGLGTIGPNAGFKTVTTDVNETGERLRQQIQRCRELTDKPFAVNFVVGMIGWDREYSERCVQVGIEEKVAVAVVSQGSPAVYTQKLKDAGMKVIHVCSTVRHVLKAEQSGADAAVVSGTEGGGHSGFDQITTMCLVPQAADAVKIPIIAGGGIVDARGLVAALSLGAEGVYMGSRFMVTQECPTHPNVKQAVLHATDTSTMAVQHGNRVRGSGQDEGKAGFVEARRGSVRMLLNDYMIRTMATQGGIDSYDDLPSSDDSGGTSESNRTVASFVNGDLENQSITTSQASGLIKDIPTCRELIERMMGDADGILARLNGLQQN